MRRDEIDNLDEVGAINYFAFLRWGIKDRQVCPACGVQDKHYWRRKRRHWRCKHCTREFSVTSGTVFQDHKLPLKTILKALFRYSMVAKGSAALELRREFGIQYKTAWNITSKLREVLLRTRDTGSMTGIVQVDGGYFGGKRRDVNFRGPRPEERDAAIKALVEGAPSQRQRRKRQFMPGGKANAERRKKRRVVFVLRELSGIEGQGAIRSVISVAYSENEVDAIAFVRKYAADKATVMSDENSAYSQLQNWYTHQTVQHSIEYRTKDGVDDNQAESFFSRLRRAEYGVYHRFTPLYLMDYANENAWREDTRRFTVREKFNDLLTRVSQAGRSRWFRGYYQGNRRKFELLNQ
jgi:transposase-like protein